MNAHRITRRLWWLVLPIAGEARTAPVSAEPRAGVERRTKAARQSGSMQGGAAVPDRDRQSQGTVNGSALFAHAEAALRTFHFRRALAGVHFRQLVVTNTADPVQGLIRAGLLAARLGTPPPQAVKAARACHA